jgi:preprotein translocase subunit SecF
MKLKLRIIQNRKYAYYFSGFLILVSLLSLIAFGLKPGIDFTGGSLLEVSFNNSRPTIVEVQDALVELDLGDVRVQPAGDDKMILRFRDVDEETHQAIVSQLKETFKVEAPEANDAVDIDVVSEGEASSDDLVTFELASDESIEEERFESIGPTIGKEIKEKAWIAIVFTVLAIILYISYVFRKVSKPVASWKYGIGAILALVHDILIVTGLFSLLGYFYGVEVNSLFITALLTILGFSVNDTIVTFDRIRENLGKHYTGDFETVVNDSVNQTITRSINTSLTTLIILFAL